MILLSLIGEQPIPNLIPLWQENAYTATRFIASDLTYTVALQLARTLENEPQLQHLELHAPVQVDAYDLPGTRKRVSELIAGYQMSGQEVCLNLTGGTKLMSMGAMWAAREAGVRMIYVNSKDEEIIHYAPDGSETARVSFYIKLSVEQYFRAHGLRVSPHPNFNDAAGRPPAPPKEGDELEEQVEKLARESNYFDDVQRGLYIAREDGSLAVSNEIDILVTRGGRLAICSCKSGENVRNVKNAAIYELNTVSRRESAGIYCGKVLVLGHDEPPMPGIKHRTQEDDVRLVYGSKIEEAAEALLIATGIKKRNGKKA